MTEGALLSQILMIEWIEVAMIYSPTRKNPIDVRITLRFRDLNLSSKYISKTKVRPDA
jgi:hypothetical protein